MPAPTPEETVQRALVLLAKGVKIPEIQQTLPVSARSLRRWHLEMKQGTLAPGPETPKPSSVVTQGVVTIPWQDWGDHLDPYPGGIQ